MKIQMKIRQMKITFTNLKRFLRTKKSQKNTLSLRKMISFVVHMIEL